MVCFGAVLAGGCIGMAGASFNEGVVADAGRADAGASDPTDAGSQYHAPDAAMVDDAGTVGGLTDSGIAHSADAGHSTDAGRLTDAGSGADAGSGVDAGQATDAGTAADGGTGTACSTKSVGFNQYGARRKFRWPTITAAPPGTAVTSACLTLVDVAGLTTIAPHDTALGAISINGGSYLTSAQPLKEGDEVRFRVNASATADGVSYVGAVFTVSTGGVENLGDIVVRSANADRAPRTFQVGPTRAFTQVSAVAPQLRAGDIVEVDPGTYSPVELTRSGTEGAPITIRGVGATRPVFSGNDANGRTVSFTMSNDLVFENFEVTGGSEICLRVQGHHLVVRNTFVHDCVRHGILGADLDSGSVSFDRIEVTRAGSTPPGEHYKHTIYIATDRDAFPNAVFRMQHSSLHDTDGEMVKSRSARVELYFNWIDARDSAATFHTLGIYGFEEYEADAPLNADIVGNVLIHRGGYGVRFGGDGTGATKGHVRLANNTFVMGSAFGAWTGFIRLFQSLDSIYLVNNAFIRSDGSGTPLTLFRNDIADADWVGGRIKIAGNSNYLPPGSSVDPAASAEWSGTLYGAGGITSPAFGAVDATPSSGSALAGVGASLSSTPVGYEVGDELVLVTDVAPAVAPASGQPLPVSVRTHGVRIGAQ